MHAEKDYFWKKYKKMDSTYRLKKLQETIKNLEELEEKETEPFRIVLVTLKQKASDLEKGII